jgi:hypothetical protein
MQAWVPAQKEPMEWLAMDLGSVKSICGVVLQVGLQPLVYAALRVGLKLLVYEALRASVASYSR